VEKLVLESYGFNSWFKEPGGDPQEVQNFMLCGFLMFWNSGEFNRCFLQCPIYFDHLYEYEDLENDPDSEAGTEFRTILDVTKTRIDLPSYVYIIYY
jgi:hypothetical protein